MVTNTIIQLIIFRNGSPRSLLFQILNIWQHPPWIPKSKNTSGVLLEITETVHGDFNGRMDTRIRNISKERKNMFDFLILLQIRSSIATTSRPLARIAWDKTREMSMTYYLSCFQILEWLIKIVYYPLLLPFQYLIVMLMWPCISLDRESYWSWIMRKIFIQCHNNPVFRFWFLHVNHLIL